MRFIVLLIIAICGMSVVKVGYNRWRAKPTAPAQAATWEASGRLRAFPTAQLTEFPHLVSSPYQANTLLDVQGYRPGELVLCQASQRPFYVPIRHDLHYGEIVGDWTIKRFDRQGPVEYRVRFIGELDGVSAYGQRMMTHGRTLPSENRTSIKLTGYFSNDHLICDYEEEISSKHTETGRFEWVFSSVKDELHGNVDTQQGLIDSQGKRITGSRGSIPASGSGAEKFVPKNWTLLDSVSGRLTGKKAQFLAMVIEEAGPQPLRWLVLAQRDRALEDYQTIITSPHACRRHLGNGKGDPLQGLSLPHDSQRPGIFGLRHHATRDYRHAGIDLWFQYDPGTQEWRLSEGRRYQFDLSDPAYKPTWSSVVPGISLAAFDIEEVQFDTQPVAERSLTEITAAR